ncbi:MAG: hypothetical protein Q7T80_10495 [Methanoregula sp.]|nr:hypothetical protein [Methanoregula sp.]
MTFPEHPEGDRHRAPADKISFNEGVLVQRIHDILCRIETDRMQEEQYLVSVIGKLRLLNRI